MIFPGPFAFQARPPAMRDNSSQSSSHVEPAPAAEEKSVTGTASATNEDPVPSAANPHGLPPLIFAAYQGDLATLEELLQDPSLDINQVSQKDGVSALVAAAGNGHVAVVAHQIEGLIGVSENVLTTLGNTMVNELVQACMAASASSDRVEIDALKARLVDAGWLAPVAQAIAVSWKSALAAQEAGPAALPASSSIKPASTSGRRRVEREAPRLFAQALLRELNSPSRIAALRTLIGGDKAAEPIDILFQAQCDQLRQFCEQTGGEG